MNESTKLNPDPMCIKNASLSLLTARGDSVVTREELEACCGNLPMAGRLAETPPTGRGPLVAGIDWGGGGTSHAVLVIGYMQEDFTFCVCRLERFADHEHPEHVLAAVAQRCRDFEIRLVAADGMGNGQLYNRMLARRLPGLPGIYAIHYSISDRCPVQEGVLWSWPVDRSAKMGVLFDRVKEQTLCFPRLQDSATFLEEFACEITMYDRHARSIIYTITDTARDDALHATNYALIVATSDYHRRSASCELAG